MNWTIDELEAEIANPSSQYDPKALKSILRKMKATPASAEQIAQRKAAADVAAQAEQERREREAQRHEERRERERQAKRETIERQRINALLDRHGYIWRKLDEESMDFAGAGAFQDRYGDASFVWQLRSSDGRDVTVAQALAEIGAE
jgi:acetyl-CoA carboxylase carboxyltransferase component